MPAKPENPAPNAPRMRDIAERLGVSLNTVSLALKNSPQISEKTRQRVRQTAKEMGYRPNPMVSALFHQINANRPQTRKASIALLDQDLAVRSKGKLPVVQQVVDGARERFAAMGYGLEEFDAAEWRGKPGRFLKILRSRGTCGLFLLNFHEAHVQLDWDLSDFALVTINYFLDSPKIHRANVNQWKAMQVALQKLQALGYRRPGLVMDKSGDVRSQGQWTSSLYHFQHHELVAEPAVPPFLDWDYADPQGTRAKCRDWLQRYCPDVILTITGEIRHFLREEGFAIPEDIGFVHLNYGGDPEPSAGVDINAPGMGRSAADLIIGQLNRNERGIPEEPKTVLVPPHWVDGPTVRQLSHGS